jgi:hypothetical protein
MDFSTAAKCTVAIIATMLGCTYWLTHTIEKAVPSGEYYEHFATLHSDLDALGRTVSAVASNTESIDHRLMSPAEALRDTLRKMPPVQQH